MSYMCIGSCNAGDKGDAERCKGGFGNIIMAYYFVLRKRKQPANAMVALGCFWPLSLLP